MRFLLVFPLLFLLILCSFVSFDAAPESAFKPVPPWSTHKARLKRSIDDSASPADYDSLSLDQLTTLLEETKKKAENEKMAFDAANSTLRAKQEEYEKAKEDYATKKEEWDKFKDFNEWRNKLAEAQKIITETNRILPELNRNYLNLETQFLIAETNLKNAQQDLEDIEGLEAGTDLVQRLTADLTRLTQDITTQTQQITSLEGIKTEKNKALSDLDREELTANVTFTIGNCDDPQKATVAPCSDAIANLKRIMQDMPAVKEAAETAAENHKVALDTRNDMESQQNRIGDRLKRLDRIKDNIPKNKEVAEINLEGAKSVKDDKEKPYLEAKTALAAAQEALKKAEDAKTDADKKLREYPPEMAKKESDANVAQDEAGKTKTKLEGELASLKSDRDEKEKILTETTATVAELQQRKDKKGSVATGGGNVALIIGPIVAIIALFLIGVAAFVFVKRRKGRGHERNKEEAESKERLLAAATQSDEKIKVGTETKPDSAKVERLPPGATRGKMACPAALMRPFTDEEEERRVECDDMNTTVGSRQVVENVQYYKDVSGNFCAKLKELIEGNIENLNTTPIYMFDNNKMVRFKMKEGCYLIASLDAHDGRIVIGATEFTLIYDIKKAYQYFGPKRSLVGKLFGSLRENPFKWKLCLEMMIVVFVNSKHKYKPPNGERWLQLYSEKVQEESIPIDYEDDGYDDERSGAGQEQEELVTAQPPTSEQPEVTEKTQKTVTITQQETGKEASEGPTVRIPDEPVTGVLKDESKKEAIDESLAEKTAIAPSCREPTQEHTGISGPDPLKPQAVVSIDQKRDSGTSKVSESRTKNPKKKSANKKKGQQKRSKQSKTEKKSRRGIGKYLFSKKRKASYSSSSSSSEGSMLSEFVDRVKAPEDIPLSRNELHFLEYHFAMCDLDKEDFLLLRGVIKRLLKQVGSLFEKGDRVVETEAPVSIITDIHGDINGLRSKFATYSSPTEPAWRRHRFVFTGDYVDRGKNSTHVLLFLCVLKALYPENIFVLRGNHEDPNCNRGYGFDVELIRLFGENGVANNRTIDMRIRITYVFARMPVAALINKRILCVHGCVPAMDQAGLIDLINQLPNVMPNPMNYPLARQILWNDPAPGVRGFETNHIRGDGFLIGADLLASICLKNFLDAIVRGHQVAANGYEIFAFGKLILVYASAYYDTNKNHGAILDIAKDGSYGFRLEVITDPLGPDPTPAQKRGLFMTTYDERWLISDLRTSNDNKLKEKHNLEKKARKEASQRKQADRSNNENTGPSITEAPAVIEEKCRN